MNRSQRTVLLLPYWPEVFGSALHAFAHSLHRHQGTFAYIPAVQMSAHHEHFHPDKWETRSSLITLNDGTISNV